MNLDNLPKGWQVKRLGEICNIVGGGTPKRDDPTFWGGNIVWVTPKELPSDSVIDIRNSENTITQKALKYSSAKLLPVGSVIYSSRATIGKIAFAAVPLATNQGFANLICNDKVYNRYLALCLRWLTPEIQRLAGQTTFPEVKKSDLKQFQIPLPSLDEQHRIVARIEELTSRIEEAKGLRLAAQKETEALMPSARHGTFETIRLAATNISLGNVCTIEMGQSPPGHSYNKGGNGLPLLNGPSEFGPNHPIPVQWTTKPTKCCARNDLLVCVRGATTGRTTWADQTYCIGRGLAAIRAQSSMLDQAYLAFYVEDQARPILDAARGSTFPNLTKKQLSAWQIPLPDLKEQRRIAAYLNGLQAKVQELRQLQDETQEQIAAMTAPMLDKAFRGRL